MHWLLKWHSVYRFALENWLSSLRLNMILYTFIIHYFLCHCRRLWREKRRQRMVAWRVVVPRGARGTQPHFARGRFENRRNAECGRVAAFLATNSQGAVSAGRADHAATRAGAEERRWRRHGGVGDQHADPRSRRRRIGRVVDVETQSRHSVSDLRITYSRMTTSCERKSRLGAPSCIPIHSLTTQLITIGNVQQMSASVLIIRVLFRFCITFIRSLAR